MQIECQTATTNGGGGAATGPPGSPSLCAKSVKFLSGQEELGDCGSWRLSGGREGKAEVGRTLRLGLLEAIPPGPPADRLPPSAALQPGAHTTSGEATTIRHHQADMKAGCNFSRSRSKAWVWGETPERLRSRFKSCLYHLLAV